MFRFIKMAYADKHQQMISLDGVDETFFFLEWNETQSLIIFDDFSLFVLISNLVISFYVQAVKCEICGKQKLCPWHFYLIVDQLIWGKVKSKFNILWIEWSLLSKHWHV